MTGREHQRYEEIDYNPVDEIVVEDCCYPIFYKIFPFCEGDPESPFWQVWSRHRLLGSRYIDICSCNLRTLKFY